MKKLKLIIGVVLFIGITTNSFAQEGTTSGGGNTPPEKLEKYYRPHRCPKPINSPAVIYNAASTELTIKFPTANGGKVEIYCKGMIVVNTKAQAGDSLCYLLRNYGRGDYTIIVSSGSTVVYSNYVIVK
ncbi:MAG: hypothetical protein J6W13_12765 [Salinivirgaceae bacterium]|nr:hypothetical protein [Salinivirgaceae bacterium]